jgi:hypothetical protein
MISLASRSVRLASLALALSAAACTSERADSEERAASEVVTCPGGSFVSHRFSDTNAWIPRGSDPDAYEMTRGAPFIGQPRVRIASKRADAPVTAFGTFMHEIPAEPFRGQRVRFSATVTGSGITGWGGLWMRVDKDATPTAFDNMANRPFTGDVATNKYEVVLDVAPDATKIAYGVLLAGAGDLSLMDAALEVVDPTTTRYEQDPHAWYRAGNAPSQDYTVGLPASHCGRPAARLASTGPAPNGFAALMQDVAADPFRGKRVRFTGFVNARTSGRASLFMRVDDARNQAVAFDNMADRPITSTNGFEKFNVVLDVPASAVTISFGLMLAGAGEATISTALIEDLDHGGPALPDNR